MLGQGEYPGTGLQLGGEGDDRVPDLVGVNTVKGKVVQAGVFGSVTPWHSNGGELGFERRRAGLTLAFETRTPSLIVTSVPTVVIET